jgi:peptidyl-tRNA hydrolase
MPEKPLKMYILVRDDVPLGVAMTAVAHASLGTYLRYAGRVEMLRWREESFRKVVCIVSAEEFERAKTFDDRVVFTESALEGAETAMGFCPREKWPHFFHTLRLFR